MSCHCPIGPFRLSQARPQWACIIFFSLMWFQFAFVSRAATTPTATPTPVPLATINVAKNGSDTTGTGAANSPYLTIGKAFKMASAGTRILVQGNTDTTPAVYNELVDCYDLAYGKSGSAGHPIVFEASPRRSVQVRGFDTTNANYLRIQGFQINDTSKRGIYLRGNYVEIVDNSFTNMGTGVETASSAPYPQGACIASNQITNVCFGLILYGSNFVVEKNEVTHLVGSGDADYCRFFGTGHVFRGNYFHGTNLADIGDSHTDGFQTFTQPDISTYNVLIEGNRIADFWEGLMLTGSNKDVHDITIRNNLFYSPSWGGSWGVCTNPSAPVYNIRVYNNVFAFLDYYGVGIRTGCGGDIKNNIFYNVPTPFYDDGGTGALTENYNLIYFTGQNANPIYDSTDILDRDPLFTNPASYDFSLRAGSPAIDSGINAGVTTDFSGVSRQQGAGYDIGAYEYVWGDTLGNQPPTVEAGTYGPLYPPATMTLAAVGRDPDNGPFPLTYTWGQVSGPATVTFSSFDAASTTVSFGAPGHYVLKVTVSDGANAVEDTTTVDVASFDDGVLRLRNDGCARGTLTPDLDYSTSCTMEALFYLRPGVQHGRYPDVMRKGQDTVAWNSAKKGWYLGIEDQKVGWMVSNGVAASFVIGDGTNRINVTSTAGDQAAPNGLAGYVHAVMVYGPADHKLTCYINGRLVGTGTSAAALNAAVLADTGTGSFSLGGEQSPGYGELNEDIHLARLWNRALSAGEIQAIFNNWKASGSHGTASVSRDGLLHEWLMNKSSASLVTDSISLSECDVTLLATGAPGTMAAVLAASGSLTQISPVDGTTEFGPSQRLIATGGPAGTNHPWSYRFQVDTASTFDSPSLKDSGWRPHYGEWVPTLAPGATYYWRVMARDTAGVTTDWVGPARFTTRAPREWFARPYDGGPYGDGSGASYVNAWRGLTPMVSAIINWNNDGIHWGEGGVEAGDTLWVCGRHLHNSAAFGTSANENERAHCWIGVDGFSSEYPVTIRGDWPDDPGWVFGYWRPYTYGATGWTWSGPDANGVWASNGPTTADLMETTLTQPIGYRREAAVTWTGHQGYSYRANSTTYVKMADGGNPAGRLWQGVSLGCGGYRFNVGRRQFIKFANLKILGSTIGGDNQTYGYLGADLSTTWPRASHIAFEGCILGWRAGTLLALYQGNDDWSVKNCALGPASIGLFGQLGSGGTVGPARGYVGYNMFTDLGDPALFTDPGAYAVCVQMPNNWVIEHNGMNNTGPAVLLSAADVTRQAKNNIIRYNLVSGTHPDASTGAGIELTGNPGEAGANQGGWQIYGNIIADAGRNGIAANWSGPGRIFNNVVYNPGQRGIIFSGTKTSPNLEIYNNIIVNPGAGYLFLSISALASGDWSLFKSDNNLFWPDPGTAGRFFISKYSGVNNLTSWQTATGQDTHSLTGDPLFTDPSRLDFLPAIGSPAIDTGRDVGLTVDADGTAIPQGNRPDIGACEAPNLPPTVEAGTYGPLTLPANSLTVTATGHDPDNRPQPLTYHWSVVTGSGVSFATPDAASTVVSFTAAGSYSIQCTASDGQATATDTAIITVNPQPAPTPQVVVKDGATTIAPGGGGVVDFGIAPVGGAAITRTFTMINAGQATLQTSGLTVPPGFVIVSALPMTLAPAASATFTLALPTTTLGTYGGTVSFSTNDRNANPCTFTVTGDIVDLVWVDFAWTGSESGTQLKPFNTLAEGVVAVKTGGIVRIKAGASAVKIRITKPLRLEAAGGTVRLGP